jgi:hypothetical protein
MCINSVVVAGMIMYVDEETVASYPSYYGCHGILMPHTFVLD